MFAANLFCRWKGWNVRIITSCFCSIGLFMLVLKESGSLSHLFAQHPYSVTRTEGLNLAILHCPEGKHNPLVGFSI